MTAGSRFDRETTNGEDRYYHLVLLAENNQGYQKMCIRDRGQVYNDMARHLDYICPMIYPSHYGDGNFGIEHPDTCLLYTSRP